MPEGSGKALWEKIYNDSIAKGDSKEKAAKKAWGGLKNAGWRKNEQGEWVKGKSYLSDFSMNFVKASFSKEEGQMRWRAVASDTDPDLYDEAMSQELYDDFVDRINNNTPIPEPFKSAICEESWCGGKPYMSLAHYKSGTGKKNVPGEIENTYKDGKMLKSVGTFSNNPIGLATFEALNRDLYKKKSDGTPEVPPEQRIRISIGFLDLKHKHILDDGTEKEFTRTDLNQICPLCSTGIGRKIYMKGQLVHEALTRVPVNPRTLLEVDKSMDIVTKKDDAASIIGKDLAEELEQKSLADGILVVKANGETEPSDIPDDMDECRDPDTGGYDQECIDNLMMGNHLPANRKTMKLESDAVKSDTVSKAVTKAEGDGNHPASHYLVVEDASKPTTWHLRVKDKSGKVDTRLLGAAHAALTVGYRGNKYAGPNAAKAEAKLRGLYRSAGLEWPEKSLTEEVNMNKSDTGKQKEWTDEAEPEDVEDVNRFNDEAGTENDATPEEMGQKKKAKSSKKPMPKDNPREEAAEAKKEAAEEEAEKAMTELFAKTRELKQRGITGKDAERILQPYLNKIGQQIDRSLAGEPTTESVLGDVAKSLSALQEEIADSRREMAELKARLNANPTGGPTVKSPFVPEPRSLRMNVTKSNAPVKQLSQIQRIANKSVGLPEE